MYVISVLYGILLCYKGVGVFSSAFVSCDIKSVFGELCN